jgi:PKD repeat protein
MADSPAAKPGKLSGLVKGIFGTATGIATGALVMYLSPLFDKVVRPSKPVANFQVQKEGFTVTLANRSAGAEEGWWDFGDGSALEPVTEEQPSIRHTYAGPGTYTARLKVKNFLGEESERVVAIVLESPTAAAPAILNLEAVPVSPVPYAPATFRVAGLASNTELCVWDYGDQRPLEITPEAADKQEKMVTFNKPGDYTIRLAAFNGSQVVEKRTTVRVAEPPRGMVTAILRVSEQATQVIRKETEPVVVINDNRARSPGNVQQINRPIQAEPGFEIVAAQVVQPGKGSKDLALTVAADRRSALLTGQYVKDKNQPAASLVVKVKLIQELRRPVTRPPQPVTTLLTVPGAGVLPLPPVPPNWVNVQRQLRLEILDGDRNVLPPGPGLPPATVLTLQQRTCRLMATTQGDQVRINLVEARPSP